MENNKWRFLKNLKIKPAYDPVIPFLGIDLEETIIKRDTCTPIFIAPRFRGYESNLNAYEYEMNMKTRI